jgi:putative ubiquitin-RnfH superfamily antitoxin RatB of RatAB toxin-antitoxin module
VKIKVEVAFADEHSQIIIPLELDKKNTLGEAIVQSGILEMFPELGIDIQKLKNQVGIFGESKTLDTPLQDGDRIEIYRKLIIDPKENRRLRARKARILQKTLKQKAKQQSKQQSKQQFKQKKS